MPYVIKYNNRVILGPYQDWNIPYMRAVIKRDAKVDMPLPREPGDFIPYISEEGIYIAECREVIPSIDNRIQHLQGPTWSVVDGMDTATYTAEERPRSVIKSELKEKVAALRYERESKGFTHTVQGQEVHVETDRDTRNIFIQAVLFMGDEDTRMWKFPGGIWLNLSKAELGGIVMAGAAHIQAQFDWEQSLMDRIELLETDADVLSIYADITPDPEDPFAPPQP